MKKCCKYKHLTRSILKTIWPQYILDRPWRQYKQSVC